jgi:DNA-binding NarL/FixJ family response regulator
MSIRILLVDDHKILRTGLRSLLQSQQNLEIVGEADNGRRAIELTKLLSPDVVIMDVGMPDLNGFEATGQVVAQVPKAKVLALSMHSDKRFVRRMFQAGAMGYLLKDASFDDLITAIQAVASNRIYLGPGIQDVVVKDYVRSFSGTEVGSFSLTSREREVLQLLAEGKKTREIATFLHLSVKTIETHRKRIMDKLGLHSVAELTKYAVREGLTSLES